MKYFRYIISTGKKQINSFVYAYVYAFPMTSILPLFLLYISLFFRPIFLLHLMHTHFCSSPCTFSMLSFSPTIHPFFRRPFWRNFSTTTKNSKSFIPPRFTLKQTHSVGDVKMCHSKITRILRLEGGNRSCKKWIERNAWDCFPCECCSSTLQLLWLTPRRQTRESITNSRCQKNAPKLQPIK